MLRDVIQASTLPIRRRVEGLWHQLQRFGLRTRLPVSDGNAARLLPTGAAIFQCLRDLIDQAQASLHFEIYLWADDATGRDLLDRLLAAQARGVRVRGVVDHLGSWDAVGRLRTAGLDLCFYHPIGWRLPWRQWQRRNHRKLLIADGTVALVASANWGEEYDDGSAPKSYRDLGLEVQGPVLCQLEADFAKSWQRAGGRGLGPPPPPRPATVAGPGWHRPVAIQVVSSLNGGRALRRHFLLILRQAQRRMVIANAYFIPDPQFLRALQRMARRGVGVDLIVPGASDHPFVQAASQSTFGRLLDAGVRIWARQVRVLHAKAAVLDEDLVLVGTANLDSASLRHNLELNLIVRSAALAEALQGTLAEEQALSSPFSLEEWRSTSAFRRGVQRFARLFWWWL